MNILIKLFGVFLINYEEYCYNCNKRLRLVGKLCSDRKHPYHLWHKKTCEKRHKDFMNFVNSYSYNIKGSENKP